MLQAIIKKGIIYSEEVPAPVVSDGSVLIKVVKSCISVGTEVSSMVASGQSLIKRALDQPEKILKVFNMVRSDGIARALENVKGELEKGKVVGYSLSGVVVGTGKGVQDFKIGDRVAAAGGGRANHAEYVDVPTNLVAKMPPDLEFQSAASLAIGAIAMHGVRRSGLQFGEYAVVLGSGIIGLLTLQILKYAWIRTAVIDIDDSRLQLARQFGAELTENPQSDDIVSDIQRWANGKGADAVLFTASTTSNVPLSQSFQMCKKKGKVILVGVSGMEIERSDIYAKELDLLVSTSYGPGRYDKYFEEKNYEYPYAYIRWTEKRNMEEYLRLVNDDHVKVKPLISNVFLIENVTEAYKSLKDPKNKSLMIVLDYGEVESSGIDQYNTHSRAIDLKHTPLKNDSINIALVGAGSFASNIHLPNLQKLKGKYTLHAICDRDSYNSKITGERYGASYVTSNIEEVLKDDKVDVIMICTRHDTHADLVLKGLKARKNVFVEKPLATTQTACDDIRSFYNQSNTKKPLLMVGFNRRFSPLAREIKKASDKRINPLFIHYRMNAGFVPLDHWIHESGGRIIGEACHIIDLMTFFTGSRIHSVNFDGLTPANEAISPVDNKSIILKYEDGSVATVEYFAVGNKSYPKEFMELHFDQKTITMDDYKSLKGYGVQITDLSSKSSQKGHFEELEAFYDSLRNDDKQWPIELWDMLQTTEITIELSK